MGVRVNSRVDFGNLAVKHTIRVGHHLNLNRLSDVTKRNVAFDDVR